MDGQPSGGTQRSAGLAGDFELKFGAEVLTIDTISKWMLGDHFNEVGTQKQILRRPSPDWNYYMAEQKAGRFFLVTARNRAGDVVGYVTMFIRRHENYDAIVAQNGVHYLMPAYRSMGNGKAMIMEANALAKARGAEMFIWRTKKGKTEHGYIFDALGFELTDLVYTKDLKNDQTYPVAAA